jgi:hypothetical protein
MRKLISIVLVLTILSGCVSTTMVRIETNVEDAEVTVDGVPLGETPVVMQMSNGIWNDPVIAISADGYRDYYGVVSKELKAVNLVCGLLLWWPSLLYVWGPKPYQLFVLVEE